MNTLKQDYAGLVYQKIITYKGNHPEKSSDRKEYSSMAFRLPVLVKKVGLVQAIAFLLDQKKDPHQQLLTDFTKVVMGEEGTPHAFLERVCHAGYKDYQLLTTKSSLALGWFKRYAQSVLKYRPGSDEIEEVSNDPV